MYFFTYVFLFLQDLASEEKKRLEEKQRTARKNRSKSEEDWKTRSVCLHADGCIGMKVLNIQVNCQPTLVVCGVSVKPTSQHWWCCCDVYRLWVCAGCSTRIRCGLGSFPLSACAPMFIREVLKRVAFSECEKDAAADGCL